MDLDPWRLFTDTPPPPPPPPQKKKKKQKQKKAETKKKQRNKTKHDHGAPAYKRQFFLHATCLVILLPVEKCGEII